MDGWSSLIPGLLDDVVLYEILPRLPWYVRPLIAALSKAWTSALLQPSLYNYPPLTTRRHYLNYGLLLLIHPAPFPSLIMHNSTNYCTQAVAITPNSTHPNFELSTLQVSSSNIVSDAVYQQDEPSAYHGRSRLGWTISILHPESKTWRWRELPPIPGRSSILHDQSGVTATAGKVFVIGGFDPATATVFSEVFMLDLESAGLWRWKKLQPLRFARYSLKCTAVEGKIYVVGGYSCVEDYASSYVTAPEVYHIQEDSWSLLPQLPSDENFSCRSIVPLSHHDVFAYGRTLNEDDDWGENPIKSARIYDSTTGAWRSVEFEYSGCCTVVCGEVYDLRSGILHSYNASTQSWRPLSGRLMVKASEAGGYACFVTDLVSCSDDKPEVYALVHAGDGETSLSLWRGDILPNDRVSWHRICCEFPVYCSYHGTRLVYLN